ncbi:MAG: Smr/MutS family protein [Bdellovibrionota bacterium]|nr:endonuclease MutS2 [Pseudobdellovibrionaceae bacterium]
MASFLNHIDWQEIIGFLRSNTNSELGKDLQSNLKELPDREAAQKSFDEIFEASQFIRFHAARPRLEGIDDYYLIKSRIEKNAKLDIPEIVKLRNFLFDLSSLLRQFADMDGVWVNEKLEQLMDPRPSLAYIEQLISPDGEFRVDASELLYKAYHEKKSLKASIHNLLEKLVKQNELDGVLQDRFVTTRDGRWVIPVKSGMQSRFEGIIHDTSASKQTVYMEPQEVVKNNNRIKELDIEIQKEIDRLLRQLSDYFYAAREELQESFDELLNLDVLFSKAFMALKMNAKPIQFSESEIDLRDLSNPVLEIQKDSDFKVVKNDLKIKSDRKCLILSGPNAGGKTIMLKSLGLSAQMVRCGLPPAAREDSKIPFFKDILISVGDAQNITEGLSTFAGHMKELTEAAEKASSEVLILVDEICGSTDPEEGSALAKAFINNFSNKGAFALITSHLGALKQNWQKEQKLEFASMEFDDASGRPIYKLLMGISGSSYALKTAARVGVPQNILDNALEELSPETKERQKKLDELELLKQQLTKANKELDFERKQANEQKQKYKNLIDQFHRERDKKLEKSIKDAHKRIDKEIEDLRNSKKNVFDVKADLPQIIKSKKETSIESPEEFNAKFPPGSEIYATNIQKNAIVQSPANAKGDVEILANSMRLTINFRFISKRDTSGFSKKKRKSNFELPTTNTHSQASSTIDLRGKMVEEALEALNDYCDSALLNGTGKVKVIHGHGTQALKKAIRSHLARAHYAESWNAGGEFDGGDGVTWIHFK